MTTNHSDVTLREANKTLRQIIEGKLVRGATITPAVVADLVSVVERHVEAITNENEALRKALDAAINLDADYWNALKERLTAERDAALARLKEIEGNYAAMENRLRALTDEWLARVEHFGSFPEAHSYAEGRERQRESCAEQVLELLPVDASLPVSTSTESEQ